MSGTRERIEEGAWAAYSNGEWDAGKGWYDLASTSGSHGQVHSKKDADLILASVNAARSIAESLPCRECDENQKHWDNAPGELRGFIDCPNGGHPDPATVAAGLPRFVTTGRAFFLKPLDIDTCLAFGEALSALVKPQEPAQ